MNLLTCQSIQPAGPGDRVFRVASWGTVFSLIFMLLPFLAGLGLFAYSYSHAVLWGMVLSGGYSLLMGGICLMIFRALKRNLSPDNWLVRIGPDGLLLKYRSYLHDDLPGDDPVILGLSWQQILETRILDETTTRQDMDGSHPVHQRYLIIALDKEHADIGRIQAALNFEHQRQPAHQRIQDLQHELFQARKNQADEETVKRLETAIKREKSLHPGARNRMRFKSRPVIFVPPDQLKVEWNQIRPGMKKLQQLLENYTVFMTDQVRLENDGQPMAEEDFNRQLQDLLARDETLAAIRLVRRQFDCSTVDAKEYIAQSGRPQIDE